MPPRRIKIYIVESDSAFRKALVQAITSEKELSICGEAGSAEPALPDIKRCTPRLVLVDLMLPQNGGLKLIQQLRCFDKQIRLLALSREAEAKYADQVLRAGCDGYFLKQEGAEEIVGAIGDVLKGHLYLSEGVMKDR